MNPRNICLMLGMGFAAALIGLLGCDLLQNGGSGNCGDGFCSTGESSASCPQDCDDGAGGQACTPGGNQCPQGFACINNRCTAGSGLACSGDDDDCDFGETCVNGFCIDEDGGGVACGDGVCEQGETLLSCPIDCIGGGPNTPVCGNDECEQGETLLSCPIDCADGGVPTCGNDTCDIGETALSCPGDCLDDDGGSSCTPTCILADQCEDGDPCTRERCVPAAAQCGAVSVCRSDPVTCPFGQTCSGGICRDNQVVCFADTDCAIGQDCVNGQCVQGP